MPAKQQPLITLALQTEVPSGNKVWNLHTAAGHLIGWSVDLPAEFTTQPSAIAYGTGASLEVQFAPGYQRVPLT